MYHYIVSNLAHPINRAAVSILRISFNYLVPIGTSLPTLVTKVPYNIHCEIGGVRGGWGGTTSDAVSTSSLTPCCQLQVS